jgi:hypothetical protein
MFHFSSFFAIGCTAIRFTMLSVSHNRKAHSWRRCESVAALDSHRSVPPQLAASFISRFFGNVRRLREYGFTYWYSTSRLVGGNSNRKTLFNTCTIILERFAFA